MNEIPILYFYDPNTFEYTHKQEAQIINGKPLIKNRSATTIEPPEYDEDHIPVFSMTSNKWILVENHRNKTPFWLPGDSYDTEARYMSTLGPLPKDAMLEQPAPSEEVLFEKLREERNKRINAVSWRLERNSEEIVLGLPLSDSNIAPILEYRQKLRDITKLEGAPFDGGGELTPWPILEI